MARQVKAVPLPGLLTGLMLLMERMMGGKTGLCIAIVLALAMNAWSNLFSDRTEQSMSGAGDLPRMKPRSAFLESGLGLI